VITDLAYIDVDAEGFLLRELAGEQPAPWRSESRLREAAAPVAAFLGARADDLVFVPNVTTGTNAVLRSVVLEPGDEVVEIRPAGRGAELTAARWRVAA